MRKVILKYIAVLILILVLACINVYWSTTYQKKYAYTVKVCQIENYLISRQFSDALFIMRDFHQVYPTYDKTYYKLVATFWMEIGKPSPALPVVNLKFPQLTKSEKEVFFNSAKNLLFNIEIPKNYCYDTNKILDVSDFIFQDDNFYLASIYNLCCLYNERKKSALANDMVLSRIQNGHISFGKSEHDCLIVALLLSKKDFAKIMSMGSEYIKVDKPSYSLSEQYMVCSYLWAIDKVEGHEKAREVARQCLMRKMIVDKYLKRLTNSLWDK